MIYPVDSAIQRLNNWGLDAWQSGHVDLYPIDCVRRAGVCQSPNFDSSPKGFICLMNTNLFLILWLNESRDAKIYSVADAGEGPGGGGGGGAPYF